MYVWSLMMRSMFLVNQNIPLVYKLGEASQCLTVTVYEDDFNAEISTNDHLHMLTDEW